MYKERIISWCCGIGAFMLVLMAGKSCMGNPQTPQKNNSAANNSQQADYTIVHPSIPQDYVEETQAQSIGYDFFGKPIYAEETSEDLSEEVSEETSETEETTSENPDAADTTESTNPTEFDFNNPDGTTTSTVSEGNTTGTETSTENVTEFPTIPPGFDGNDHRVYDEEGNEVATIPPDFVIVID